MATINKGKKRKVEYCKREHTEQSSKFYTNKWYRLRNAYLMLHPLCEKCLEKGKAVPAAEVHHIVPISTGNSLEEMMGLAYNPRNLMALCTACHHKIHQEMKKRNK